MNILGLEFLFRTPVPTVKRTQFSSDCRAIASGSNDGTIKVWDLNSGDCRCVLGGGYDSVFALAFSSEGRRIVSGSDGGKIKVWDLDSGYCLHTLDGHTSHSGSVNALALSSDGRTLVSGSWDKTVKVWDFDTWKLTATFFADAGIHAVALAGADQIIAGDHNGHIHWLRLRTPEE
jgi:WD40 repeat protein